MTRVLLGVKGMNSKERADKIKQVLLSVEGVEKVEADKSEQAAVTYDEGMVTVMDLVGTLRRLGIRAGME